MKTISPRIVIICPVRDEEKYLQKFLDSIVNQTVKPVELVVVDDGSTDKTPGIIQEAHRKHPWIHGITRSNRGERAVGPGVVEAFYDGYAAIESEEYDFVGKFDGDLILDPKYFETLVNKFEEDAALGAASGKLFLQLENGELIAERHSDEMVVGGTQFYRRECYEAMGGYVRQVMWDGIAYHRCRMNGWRTKSFHDPELKIREQRAMGASQKSIYHGRIRWGWGQYFMGTHPLYILVVGCYRMFERPFIVGGLLIVCGYIKGCIQRARRYEYPGFRESLHAWQFERLKLGKRLETLPPAPSPSQETIR